MFEEHREHMRPRGTVHETDVNIQVLLVQLIFFSTLEERGKLGLCVREYVDTFECQRGWGISD
jgi:hypothetical protein